MKKIVFSLLLITITSVITNAQSKQEKAVMDAVEQLRKGMIDADKAILEKLVTDKLSYGHSGGHIDDKKEFVEKIVSGKSDFVSIDLSEQTISVSGKTAIVRHILKAKTNDGGKPADVQLRVLLIWQKQGGHWKLLARQAVKLA
ncbi:MAG: nuclear transport factor 2 family protein [Chitinophagaceae bacterium]|nr:nuclear transport factor 2 family protein [Chitinophagaceae bacterium]